MYGRTGLDRFKKAQTLEPFSVSLNSAQKTTPESNLKLEHSAASIVLHRPVGQEEVDAAALDVQGQQVTQIGGGQSTWQPPDWAIEPRSGVYYLEVLKDGQVLDRINLDRRRHIFGRQLQTCDFVLDHQSVSRQHAAVVPHKNGSVYVIDLGSVHGTFVASERLTKDSPVELEVGQSLRFAASTRTYILRKDSAALFPSAPLPSEINLPPPPDPSDEEALVEYNTLINRYGLTKSELASKLSNYSNYSNLPVTRDESKQSERSTKRMRRLRVTFKDEEGGQLVDVVGISDGAGVDTEPGPIGVKEGSLVGKYESLVQTTVVPKHKEQSYVKEDSTLQKGVTDKLKEVLNKVKGAPKGGIYDDLYGVSSGKVGSSWAYGSTGSGIGATPSTNDSAGNTVVVTSGKPRNDSASYGNEEDDDDLFGD